MTPTLDVPVLLTFSFHNQFSGAKTTEGFIRNTRVTVWKLNQFKAIQVISSCISNNLGIFELLRSIFATTKQKTSTYEFCSFDAVF